MGMESTWGPRRKARTPTTITAKPNKGEAQRDAPAPHQARNDAEILPKGLGGLEEFTVAKRPTTFSGATQRAISRQAAEAAARVRLETGSHSMVTYDAPSTRKDPAADETKTGNGAKTVPPPFK